METPETLYPVAIVGVGNMGGAMAQNLLSRGWPVHVSDIDIARMEALAALGATPHRHAADAARAARATIVCVVDAAQCSDVLFVGGGVAEAMQLGQPVLLCPTLGPGDVEEIAERLHRYGLHAVDAPMSGGPARARDGSMSLMVACSPSAWLRCQGLVEVLSSKIFRIGERPGDGARTKLVNNLAAGINLVGAAEVLALAQRLGLDLSRTLDVVEQSSGQSWIGSDRMRRAIAGDLEPRAHMTLLQKDTRLAMDMARAVGFEGPLGAAARDTFAQASADGLDDRDDAALLQWLLRQKR